MSRHFFLIALLSVLLPGGVAPSEMATDRVAVARPFVVALRGLPGVARAAARTVRRSVVARRVRGVYLVSARQPKALLANRHQPAPFPRLLWRPMGRRAPPAFV